MDTTIFLIRHAETVWNREGRMQGFQDSPLSETGTSQSEALGRRLRDMRLDAFHSSDSPRCVRTARIAMGGASLPLTLSAGLRERNLGEWESRTWKDIVDSEPESARLYKSSATHRPPGGETFLELQERVMSTIKAIVKAHPSQRVAVFTSGGTIRAGVFAALALPADNWGRFVTWNTGITRLDFHDSGWKLIKFNDVSHLPGTGDGHAVF